MQAVNLAVRHPEILDSLVSALHPKTQEDVPGPVERDAATGRHVGRGVVVLGIGLVDGLLVDPCAVLEASADELDHGFGAEAAVGAAVAEAQVDPAVLRVVRMRRHIQYPAEPVLQRAHSECLPVTHRCAGDEFRLRAIGGDHGEAAHFLRQQDAAVRQRRDGVGQGLEVTDHLRQAVAVALGLDDPVGQFERWRHPEIGERRVGAFLGDQDGQTADLCFAEGLRPRGHAEIRRALGDALGDGLHAFAPDQRCADERVALGRALEAVTMADGAVLPVEPFERLGPALARRASSREAHKRNNEDGKRHTGSPNLMR